MTINKKQMTMTALLLVMAIGVVGSVSAFDAVEEDGLESSFIMVFSDFNGTLTHSDGIDIFQVKSLGMIYGDENQAQNNHDGEVLINVGSKYAETMMINEKTDGNSFEFTWLIFHTSPTGLIGTSEIGVRGDCNYSGVITIDEPRPIIFTTVQGDLEISINEVPSPDNGLFSSFSATCSTP